MPWPLVEAPAHRLPRLSLVGCTAGEGEAPVAQGWGHLTPACCLAALGSPPGVMPVTQGCARHEWGEAVGPAGGGSWAPSTAALGGLRLGPGLSELFSPRHALGPTLCRADLRAMTQATWLPQAAPCHGQATWLAGRRAWPRRAAVEERLGSAADRSDRGKQETGRAGGQAGGHQGPCAPALAGVQERCCEGTGPLPAPTAPGRAPGCGQPGAAGHLGLAMGHSPLQPPRLALLSPLLLLSLPPSPRSPPSSLPPSPPILQRTLGGTQAGITTPLYRRGPERAGGLPQPRSSTT